MKPKLHDSSFAVLEFKKKSTKLNACISVWIYHYYIHTEMYTLESRRVNFRLQTDVNQSNVAYHFSHM